MQGMVRPKGNRPHSVTTCAGRGTPRWLSIPSLACAANGSIAWSMPRHAHAAAALRLQARKDAARPACVEAKGDLTVACKTAAKVKPAAKT
jgi:hypothetical protein